MISEDYLQGDYKASLLSIGALRSLTRQKNGFLFSMIPWKRKFHRVKFKTPLRLSLPFLSQFENIPTNLHIGGFDHVRQTEQDETIQRDLIHGIAVLACQ